MPIMKTGLLRMLVANPLTLLQELLPLRLAGRSTQEPLAHVLAPLLGQGLQNLLLPPAQLLGHDDPDPHNKIPGRPIIAPPRPRSPGPPHLEPLAVLCPGRQPE